MRGYDIHRHPPSFVTTSYADALPRDYYRDTAFWLNQPTNEYHYKPTRQPDLLLNVYNLLPQPP